MLRLQIILSVAAFTFSGLIPRHTMSFTNGKRVHPFYEFPDQVALMNGDAHICSGVLIAHGWVLTSAHCVVDISLIDLTVVLDVHDYANPGGYKRVQIEQKIIHKNYTKTPVGIQNDVALLRLRPSTFDISEKITKITSRNNKTYAGQNCTTRGWGMNGANDSIPEVANVYVLSNEECFDYWTTRYLFDEHVCAQAYSTAEGSIPCNTDAGAPLVCNDELVGVNSWGLHYCLGTFLLLTYPRVYARVTSYKDWINSNCHDCSV